MKRIAVNVTSSLITFAVGLAVASISNWNKYPVNNERRNTNVLAALPTSNYDTSGPTVTSPPTATPDREIAFAGGRLRIVSDEVHLKSERLRYEIDVSCPQIVGTEDLHVRKLNQRIKELATEQYQWPLNPSKADLRYYRNKWPEVFNSVHLDYEMICDPVRYNRLCTSVPQDKIPYGCGPES
jgi:hypothetical protein